MKLEEFILEMANKNVSLKSELVIVTRTEAGGSRPKDLYWRIHVSIKGTPMPAAGPMPGAAGALAPEEIWHVVNYVRSLAGEGMDEG